MDFTFSCLKAAAVVVLLFSPCLAISQESPLPLARFSLLKAQCDSLLGFNNEAALKNAETMLMLGRAMQNDSLAALGLHYVALAQDYRGDYAKALDNHFLALRLREDLNEPQGIAASLQNIGVIYLFQNDNERALEYLLQAESLNEKLRDTLRLAKVVNNIGIIYRRKNLYDQAIAYYEKSLALKTALGDKKGIIASFSNIGTVYQFKGNYLTALTYELQVLALEEELGDGYGKAASLINVGIRYLKLNDFENAERYLQQGVSLSERVGAKDVLLEGYESLTELSALKKDFQSAFAHQKNYFALKDSLFSTDKNRQLLEVETKYQTEKKEREIELLKKESEVQDVVRNSLVGGLTLVAALLLMAYRGFRQKQKANILIEQALKERNLLMQEMNHRVKNNLQVISSLLDLQSRQTKETAAQSAMREAKSRVKSMALIHQKLYQQDAVKAVVVKEYLYDLSESLFESYRASAEKIQFESDIDDLLLDVDVVIPLGLIINELISNALKYAFTGRASGKLSLSLKRNAAGLTLRVSDDGNGLPENFQLATAASFGMKLVLSLVKKLDAEFAWSSASGAAFVLSIPNEKLKFEKSHNVL